MPGTLPRFEYARLLEQLLAHRSVRWSTYGEVVEQGVRYPLHEAHLPGEPEVLITTGFHGEERGGPLTMAAHLDALAEHARSRGVGLRVFPCLNPSGFEAGRRYNLSGERPNNDLLRYEVAPGVWKGELAPGEAFLRWTVFEGGPKETRAVRARLEALPPPRAALDLHQDHHLRGGFVYAYVFGDRAPYRALVDACGAHAQVARAMPVDEVHQTGPDGLIVSHDGSVTDYCWRRGVPFTAALETTTELPPEQVEAINLIWCRGFIDLAAAR